MTDDELYPSVDNVGRLIEDEKVEVGAIPFSTYKTYLKSTGGYILSFFVLSMFVINVVGTGNLMRYFLDLINPR